MHILIRNPGRLPSLLLSLMLVLAPDIHAQQSISPPPGPTSTTKTNADILATYKKMSVEELMNIEVTSVSRHPEKLLEAASAIQVITGEEIRRSGATKNSSLPSRRQRDIFPPS